MSFDQFGIAAGCPARLVLVKWHIKCHQRWDYKMHELTTRHYSVGEVWASLTKSKTIFCAGSIPKDIRRVKKQICGESAETISRLRVESCTTGNVPHEWGTLENMCKKRGWKEENPWVMPCWPYKYVKYNLAIVYIKTSTSKLLNFSRYRWPLWPWQDSRKDLQSILLEEHDIVWWHSGICPVVPKMPADECSVYQVKYQTRPNSCWATSVASSKCDVILKYILTNRPKKVCSNYKYITLQVGIDLIGPLQSHQEEISMSSHWLTTSANGRRHQLSQTRMQLE